MAAMEPLCHLIGIKTSNLTKEENLFLEAELFIRVCDEIKNNFKKRHKEYFRLLNLAIDKENEMLEICFIRLIITDILSTEEYTIEGIAHYTNTHKDVIEEIFTARNANPSALFLRRLIELHRTIRRNFYLTIMKKITSEGISV